jgi:hydrogenase maturation protease
MAKTLVLGVGNYLMGDEGIGVHAARVLQESQEPIGAEIVDGGTGGFHLLSYFEEYDPIIMIDATMDGRPPGTITLLRPRFSWDFPRVLSAHDIGLRDLVESAALLGPLPAIYLIAISVESLQPMQTELSPEVRSVLPRIAEMVRILAQTGKQAEQGGAGGGPR